MKIVHTSDWHLGKYLYGRSLLPDQEHFIFEEFLPFLRDDPPDLVVLAGDVFDRQIAPVEALRLFDRFLLELDALRLPLAVVAGNHDGADRMAVGAALLRKSGVFIAGRGDEVLAPITLKNQRGKTEELDLFLLPWCEPAQIRAILGRDDLHTFNSAYVALLDEARKRLRPGVPSLLAAHCFVAGGAVSASESPVYVGAGGDVSAEAFAGFDYVALGHLHAPQRAGENGRYSGSPLKYSFDEAKQRKSVSVISLSKGHTDITEKTFAPLHGLRVLSGSFAELTENEPPTDDYVYARLLDDGPVYMPMDRLRERFPNILGLNSLWLERSAHGDPALREQLMTRKTDDAELFRQFMLSVCGEEPGDDDIKLFLEAMTPREDEE